MLNVLQDLAHIAEHAWLVICLALIPKLASPQLAKILALTALMARAGVANMGMF